MIKFTKTLRKGVLILLFAILCLPQAAMTQDSNKTTRIAASSDNEIIVSARRKAEKVQDVPLSIQVITAEDIEVKKINEGIDIAMDIGAKASALKHVQVHPTGLVILKFLLRSRHIL